MGDRRGAEAENSGVGGDREGGRGERPKVGATDRGCRFGPESFPNPISICLLLLPTPIAFRYSGKPEEYSVSLVNSPGHCTE